VITIVDYGMGNLGSIRNMLKKIGADAEISADPARIGAATKLILPGVGAFDAGIANLDASGLVPLLNDRVMTTGVPVLGICLGMQLMAHRSSEGSRPGLGWIDAEVHRLQPADPSLKVPHMGWSLVQPLRSAPLLDDLPDEPRFYFVHSYYIRCRNPGDVLLETRYGGPFASAVHHANIWGVQFHPEKSHRYGMHLLRNFASRC
jgi:imidazole glycerol-phosphate synthase subunit HisH